MKKILVTGAVGQIGSELTMELRNRYGAGGSDYWEEDGLIKFDLSSIPSGLQIDVATLHLWYYGYDDSNPGGR